MTSANPLATRCAGPRFFLSLLLLLLAPFLVAAQPSPEGVPGPVIERLEVRNAFEIQPQVVTYPLTLKVGDPYDEQILRRDFRKIMETGFFERVILQVADGAQGKILVFWVEEKPVVKSVDYRGFKRGVSKQTLEEKLQEEDLTIKINSRLDPGLVEKVRLGILSVLHDKGYEDATVEVEIQNVSPVARAVYFNVQEGRKVKIGEVRFTGNTVFSEKKLKRRMKKTRESFIFSWLTQHNILSQEKLEEDLGKVRDLYKEHGYARVNVLDPVVERYNAAGEGKKPVTRLRLTIGVEEGEPYKLGSLAVRGNKLFTSEEILGGLKLKPGEIFNQKLLKETLEALDTSYGIQGYIFAYVDPLLGFHDETLTVDLTLDVEEGEKYFLRNLEFEGNTSTRDKVLRREMRLREGGVFNEEAFKNSLLKINQLGYFTLLEESGNPEIIPSMEGNEVDVIIKGEESGKNQLEVGGGISGLEGGFGRLMFSTRNFLGRGEILTAEALLGTRADRYTLSFTEPYLFDRNYILGAELFKRNYIYYDHWEERTGAATRFGMPLGYFSRFMIRYGYEIIDISFRNQTLQRRGKPDLDPATPAGRFSYRTLYEEGETVTSSITPTFSFSTVNNPFRPSRGQSFDASLQLAGGPLGGENYFIKPGASYTRFLPVWKKTFLGAHVEAAYVTDFGGGDLPGFERLFLGGEFSIRGTRVRTVGPLDEQGLFIGGTSSAVANLEYHIPFKDTPLEGLLFFDVGNAWDEDHLFDVSDLVLSYGLELRIYLPIFPYPLRFIYSLLPEPPPRNSSSDFQFTIGASF